MGVIYETHSSAVSPLCLSSSALLRFVSNPLKRMAEKEERGKEEEMAAITAAVKGGKESELCAAHRVTTKCFGAAENSLASTCA